MPQNRKSIQELKDTGRWEKMSRTEKRQHEEWEGIYRHGRPIAPYGLDLDTAHKFYSICDQLAAKRALAASDGDLILGYLAALDSNDMGKAVEIQAFLEGRNFYSGGRRRSNEVEP